MSDIQTDVDAVDDSKAPLISHLIELRQRLIWAIAGITIAFLICFYFSDDLFRILLWPAASAAGGYSKLQMIYTSPTGIFFHQTEAGIVWCNIYGVSVDCLTSLYVCGTWPV